MARILVIDDSVSILERVAQMLSQAGHETVLAKNGKIGMQIVGREALDLVITDVYMPEADGLEVIRLARKMHPELPVIVMSSKTGELGMLRAARALGATFTLQKPFSEEQLLGRVKKAMAPS